MLAFHSAACVVYQVSILNRDGSLARVLPAKRNLILDQGLDGLVLRTWEQSFAVAVVGTGTTPTKRDSGAITVSRAGATLTASAGFFEAADVGRLFKFDTGEEVRITGFTDALTVTTDTAGTIAAAEGTVWYVNQQGLAAESKRSNTYSTSAGECGTTVVMPTITMKRTFVFAAETGTVTYREIGWSHTTAVANNLFGRDLLAGVGVTLVAGQQLKVSVQLAVTFSPAAPVAYANVVTGWATGGQFALEGANIRTVDAAGAQTAVNDQMEPSVTPVLAVDSSAPALAALATNSYQTMTGTRASGTATLAGYSAGSFTRSATYTFGVGVGNFAIRSLYLAGDAVNTQRSVARVLLDAPGETKANTHTLSLTFTKTWGRVLIN